MYCWWAPTRGGPPLWISVCSVMRVNDQHSRVCRVAVLSCIRRSSSSCACIRHAGKSVLRPQKMCCGGATLTEEPPIETGKPPAMCPYYIACVARMQNGSVDFETVKKELHTTVCFVYMRCAGFLLQIVCTFWCACVCDCLHNKNRAGVAVGGASASRPLAY